MTYRLALLGGPRALGQDVPDEWPPITSTDEALVLRSLRGSDHSYGAHCRKFEEEFAAWVGCEFAINTNSGTAALHMCIAAVGCSAGDEVIVPAYSWSSSATAALHHNCVPVFVDIDWRTMNLDPSQIEKAITPRTRAIVAVHLHGLAADMPAIRKIASKHGLKVIEDACQAHGAEVNGQKVGTLGDCAAFSFNQRKTICAGDAGMFVTNSPELNENARRLWSFGEDRLPSEDRDYHAYALGWMYRSNDLTAAFGLGQLRRADEYLGWQRHNAFALLDSLSSSPYIECPVTPHGYRHTYSTFTVRLDLSAIEEEVGPGITRDRIVQAIAAEGIPQGLVTWQRHILPDMTVFRARNAYGHGCPWECQHRGGREPVMEAFPIAQRHCECSFGINTPMRRPIDESGGERIGLAINKVLGNLHELVH